MEYCHWLQCTKVNGYLNLGVKQFKMKDKQQREQFGPWSGVLTVGPRATENFSAEITLKSLPPTTNCEQIDITYQVMVSIQYLHCVTYLQHYTYINCLYWFLVFYRLT